MYEHLAPVYDYFVNWKSRLAYELPFLKNEFSRLSDNPHELKVLDAACGTGRHAIALATEGFEMSGADLYPEMVSQAQANAFAADQNLNLKTVGFGNMSKAFNGDQFDAVLCLGNSLPHVQSQKELSQTLADFAALVKPGGIMILQSRNFDRVVKNKLRWMDPQAVDESTKHYVFFRFYDFLPNGLIQFNILTLSRGVSQDWQTELDTTLLYPTLSEQLLEEITKVGFEEVRFYGNMAGDCFDPESSSDLVVVATKGMA
ncbi:MAG TPA: methyltransferase domain-containing protein [Anaerolineaceae bacterium]|nr:methyltransferase domain-containing protein [Anaerolineaceae bacterium]